MNTFPIAGAALLTVMTVSASASYAQAAKADTGTFEARFIKPDPLPPAFPVGHKAQVTRVIKIKIKNNFNITAIERDIHNFAYDQVNEDETGPQGTDPGLPSVTNFQTPLDIKIGKDELVMIKIHINNSQIRFYDEPVSGGWDAATGKKYCYLGGRFTLTGIEKAVRIYCKLPTALTEISLNINLILTQTTAGVTYETPVTIDPHIKNDG